MDFFWQYDSPIGGLTMASDGQSLVGLSFNRKSPDAVASDGQREMLRLPVFDETCRWLDVYFDGREPDFTPPLALHATPFRQAVCEILLTIPFGKTMTYGEIASRIAWQQGLQRMSAQAVGGAVGHNPFAIIVPCHRVIGADGGLTGYAAGLDKKQWLLRHEQII